MHDRIEWTPFSKPPEPGQAVLVCIKYIENAPFIAHIEHYTKGLENSLGLFSQVVGWMPANLILEAPMGYDPMFGDERLCLCGHPYYRHFDTYEEMSPVGCKYCHAYEEGVEYRREADRPSPEDLDDAAWQARWAVYADSPPSICSGFKWDGVGVPLADWEVARHAKA